MMLQSTEALVRRFYALHDFMWAYRESVGELNELQKEGWLIARDERNAIYSSLFWKHGIVFDLPVRRLTEEETAFAISECIANA